MKIKAKRTKAHEPLTVTIHDGCGLIEMPLHEAAALVKNNGLAFCPSSGEWK